MTIIEPDSTYRGLYKTSKLPSCVLTPADLRRLFGELNVLSLEAANRQLSSVAQPSNMNGEDFHRWKQDIQSRIGLTITVIAAHGRQIVGTSSAVLEDVNLPDGITQIVFNSASAYRSAMNNQQPLDRFTLTIDFTETPSVYSYNQWDQSTPNMSNLEVIGATDTWVTTVYENSLAFFRRRHRVREWLHSNVTFNLANWLIGFPAAFWFVYRIDQLLSHFFVAIPIVLRGAIYVYLVLLGLLIFRSCLAILRWAYPLVELAGAKSAKVRAIASVVVLGLFSSLIYDIIKAVIAR